MGNSRSASYSYQHSRSVDGVNSVDDVPDGGGGGAGAFIRHRNIRMPRINMKDVNPLMPHSRVKSYSCSMMTSPASQTSASVVVAHTESDPVEGCNVQGAVVDFPFDFGDAGYGIDSVVDAHDADDAGWQYRTASCTALLQCDHNEIDEVIDEGLANRRQASLGVGSVLDVSSVSSPFRRQFLSLRSRRDRTSRYYQQPPPLPLPTLPLLSNSSSFNGGGGIGDVSMSSLRSSSLLFLSSLDTSGLRSKMRSYLELARQKKDNIEQSLSQTWSSHPPESYVHQHLHVDVDDGDLTRVGGGSGLVMTVEEVDGGCSWISSLDADDAGYTTTTTLTTNDVPDSSLLTLTSAHTSLSSGYKCGDLMIDHVDHVEDIGSDHDHVTTSGSFYLNWLRQILGHVPPYVELRQGRLHLKIVSG